MGAVATLSYRVKEYARAKLLKVRETPEYKESLKRWLINDFHPRQRKAYDLIAQGERYISLCCGRRAGKTRFLAALIIILLLECDFGQEVVFVAPTLKRGKELIWAEVSRMVDDFCLGWRMVEQTGVVVTDQKAMFRIVGLDNKKQIGKIARGGNTRAFLADEVQEFSHLLEKLVDAASPALAQTRGLFLCSGTPGYVKRGYWFDICHKKDGFLNVSWTLFDNPFLGRDAQEIVDEEIAKKKWHKRHPTLLREYYAIWIDDEGRIVVDLADFNILTQIPGYNKKTWKHVIGVDYGNSPDPCAWVVLAAHPHENYVAAIHAETGERMTSDQICEKTNALRLQYGARRIVGDSASGGKTFIQDFNERHARKAGFAMLPADKADKEDSIDLVNTELRHGRLVLLVNDELESDASELVEEMQGLQWDEDHKEFLPGPDHCYDSARYSLRALRAFLAKPAPGDKTEDDKELERIIARNKRAEAQRDSYAD